MLDRANCSLKHKLSAALNHKLSVSDNLRDWTGNVLGRAGCPYLAFPRSEEIAMATIELRDLHLVKKALAIAVLVMEGQGGPLQSSDDKFDMKLLLERLTNEAELEHYTRAAWIAVMGAPPEGG